MRDRIKESDWKVFRGVHQQALLRYCDRVLSELRYISTDSETTSHQRYLKVYKLIHERDGFRPKPNQFYFVTFVSFVVPPFSFDMRGTTKETKDTKTLRTKDHLPAELQPVLPEFSFSGYHQATEKDFIHDPCEPRP